MRKNVVTGIAVLAGVLVLVLAGLNWRSFSAWIALQTRFERVSKGDGRTQAYRHKDTGIVFELVVPEN